jgi:hypothetical protein
VRAPGRAVHRQVVLLLLLAGPAWGQDCPRIDRDRQQAEEKACRAAGDEWGRFGVLAHLCGVYSCVRRTRDGGKPCLGRSECEFLCVSRRELPLGSAVTGECAALATQFGCAVHVEGGKVVGRVCVD